jgi:hypothetical protein
MLGFLYFGDQKVIKFQNMYKMNKIIHKVMDF